jgi:hypothetical protein
MRESPTRPEIPDTHERRRARIRAAAAFSLLLLAPKCVSCVLVWWGALVVFVGATSGAPEWCGTVSGTGPTSIDAAAWLGATTAACLLGSRRMPLCRHSPGRNNESAACTRKR